MKRIALRFWLLVLIITIVSITGCTSSNNSTKKEADTTQSTANKTVKLATTTSTQDSGLLDVLEPKYENDTGYKLSIIAVGSGQAISLGEKGDVDVLLVHSREAEDKFVAAGFGINRKDVMHNDFIIIGPANDPAGISGEMDANRAFRRIAETQSIFVSRGDKSGTNIKELALWEKAGIAPQGNWYKSVGMGMGDTFQMADELKGYTLIDRATYLALKNKYKLEILVEKDTSLLNKYGVVAVNPAKYPNVNNKGAMKFIDWITSPEIQRVIANFGKDKYGQPLFTPDAVSSVK